MYLHMIGFSRNPHHTAQKVAFTPNPHARHLEYSQSTKEICKTMIVNYLPWCMTAIVKQNPLTFRSTRVVIPEEPWILGSCSQSRAHICTLMLCLSENLYHIKNYNLHVTYLVVYAASAKWYSSERDTNAEQPSKTPKIFSKYQRNMQNNDIN